MPGTLTRVELVQNGNGARHLVHRLLADTILLRCVDVDTALYIHGDAARVDEVIARSRMLLDRLGNELCPILGHQSGGRAGEFAALDF